MTAARFQHTATLLDDGRVLIAGGSSVADHFLGTTEFWDPATEQFTSGPPLAVSRFGHTATRLADGRVVIIGGYVGVGRDLSVPDRSNCGIPRPGRSAPPAAPSFLAVEASARCCWPTVGC